MSTRTEATTYTIKEVSNLTGLPSSTLRYYESIGIIDPIRRDASSKQRVYEERDLNIISTTACLNATGMSIEDMKRYIRNIKRGEEGAHEQVALLRGQKRHLAAELKMMKVRQQYVDLKIEYWEAVEAGDAVRVKAITKEAIKLAHILIDAKDS